MLMKNWILSNTLGWIGTVSADMDSSRPVFSIGPPDPESSVAIQTAPWFPTIPLTSLRTRRELKKFCKGWSALSKTLEWNHQIKPFILVLLTSPAIPFNSPFTYLLQTLILIPVPTLTTLIWIPIPSKITSFHNQYPEEKGAEGPVIRRCLHSRYTDCPLCQMLVALGMSYI